MVNVIGVRFENAGKLFYFESGEMWPMPGDYAVVETTHGQSLGEVVTPVQQIDESTLSTPLQPMIRVAGAEDMAHHQENKAAEKEAFALCQKKIAEHKLDMKLVSAEFTFDNSKLLFYFTSNGRVDFRSLVKDLAGVFRTRIELRQIGVRDEAKMIGGLGPCGRPICCAAFLGDFQPVSIKMAKEQNLSLNPIKISGVCGRLMCCLKYEQDTYEETRKRLPRVGKDVITPDGTGTVLDVNVIREMVKVRVPKGDGYEIKDYPAADVQRPGMQQPVQKEQESAEDEAALTTEARTPAKPDRPARQTSEERGERRPARDQKPNRRDQGKQEDAAPAAKKPIQQPAAPSTEAPQSRPAAAEQPVPRQNAWKAALDQAIRAANESAGAPAEAQPVNQPTPSAAQPVEDEDDTI